MKKGIHPSHGCAAPAKRAGSERNLIASILLSGATPCLQESLFHPFLCPTWILILSAEDGGCEEAEGQSRGVSQDKDGLRAQATMAAGTAQGHVPLLIWRPHMTDFMVLE